VLFEPVTEIWSGLNWSARRSKFWSARDLMAFALLAVLMDPSGFEPTEGSVRGELRGEPGEFLDTVGDTFLRGVRHWVHLMVLG